MSCMSAEWWCIGMHEGVADLVRGSQGRSPSTGALPSTCCAWTHVIAMRSLRKHLHPALSPAAPVPLPRTCCACALPSHLLRPCCCACALPSCTLSSTCCACTLPSLYLLGMP
jgi:hypothetical protein